MSTGMLLWLPIAAVHAFVVVRVVQDQVLLASLVKVGIAT